MYFAELLEDFFTVPAVYTDELPPARAFAAAICAAVGLAADDVFGAAITFGAVLGADFEKPDFLLLLPQFLAPT